MKVCTRHPHRTPEKAARCYARELGRRADRRLRLTADLSLPRYAQVKLWPPEVREGPVPVLYFFTAAPRTRSEMGTAIGE
jgi:hypothetical protein